MKIKEGQQAPDFTLFDQDNNPVTLSALRGKNVVLLFFPFAFSGTCTKELCTMRDDIASYEDLDAVVLGISVDSRFGLKKFRDDQRLNFPLLSDFNKIVSEAYGCLYNQFIGMKGVSKRSAFVIGKDGIVRYAEVLEDAAAIPDFKKVKEALAK